MTTSDDRLDRLEALAEATLSIADSNARAIEALANENREMRARQDEADQQMRARMEQADQRLRESINDVIEMVGDLAQQQQETDQRFNNLLAEARADRSREDAAQQENRREHREFRAFMRQTLQELREIWQRIAG